VIQQNADGAEIKAGNASITEKASGKHAILCGKHTVSSGGGGTPEKPEILSGDIKTHNQFVFTDELGQPLSNKKFKVTLSDGTVLTGTTNGDGETKLVKDKTFKGAIFELL
jgi:uncharacterized protein (DUF2345 family)